MPGTADWKTPLTAGAEVAVGVAAQLRRLVRGNVSDGLRRRAEYSSDAGNYRVLPTVVVQPRDIDDVLATLAISRQTGVPVTSRGGGTSIAGNAIGGGIVIDFARHLNKVLDVDPGSRRGETTITMQYFAIPAVTNEATPLHDGTTTLPTMVPSHREAFFWMIRLMPFKMTFKMAAPSTAPSRVPCPP